MCLKSQQCRQTKQPLATFTVRGLGGNFWHIHKWAIDKTINIIGLLMTEAHIANCASKLGLFSSQGGQISIIRKPKYCTKSN